MTGINFEKSFEILKISASCSGSEMKSQAGKTLPEKQEKRGAQGNPTLG